MKQKELKNIFSSFSDKYKIQNWVGGWREREKEVVYGWCKKGNKNLDLSSTHHVAGEVESKESSYINAVNPHKIQCRGYSLTSIWLARNLTYGEIKKLPKSLQLVIEDPRLECGSRAARDPCSDHCVVLTSEENSRKGNQQRQTQAAMGEGATKLSLRPAE